MTDRVLIALVIVGILACALAAFSLSAERRGIPRLLVALCLGLLIGPEILGFVDPTALGYGSATATAEISRVVLVVTLCGVALRLPGRAWRSRRRWIVLSIALGMPLMFVVATGAVALLGLPLLVAAAVGAAITPTDPVVITPIVTGPEAERRIPTSVRWDLSAESGLNDGLGYLLLMLPVLLLTRPADLAWQEWGSTVLLIDVLVPIVGGLAIGAVGGLLYTHTAEHAEAEPTSRVPFALSLVIVTFAVLRLAGLDAVLGAFGAAVAFAVIVPEPIRASLSEHVEGISQFLIVPVFALIGTLIPVSWLLGQSPWLVPVLLLALLGRRLAAVWMLRPLLGRVQSLPETAFISWFAPVGVSALLYASLAAQETGTDDIRRIVLVAIALSVLVHGLSTLPASLLLDRARARAARRG